MAFKDVRAKNFYKTDFFILWLHVQSDRVTHVRNAKKLGVTDFVFEIKGVENYPNFDKSALITRL